MYMYMYEQYMYMYMYEILHIIIYNDIAIEFEWSCCQHVSCYPFDEKDIPLKSQTLSAKEEIEARYLSLDFVSYANTLNMNKWCKFTNLKAEMRESWGYTWSLQNR